VGYDVWDGSGQDNHWVNGCLLSCIMHYCLRDDSTGRLANGRSSHMVASTVPARGCVVGNVIKVVVLGLWVN